MTKVRNAVSDEMILHMAIFTGMKIRCGDYYIRQDGHLLRLNIGEKSPEKGMNCKGKRFLELQLEERIGLMIGKEVYAQDLGSQDKPENLALHYRNLKDATLKERLRMVAGGIINLTEYIAAMGQDGWWNRQKFLRKYQSKTD